MSDFEERCRTTKYVEFALPNPTNIAELTKAIMAAERKLSGVAIHDDTIQIRADEDEIVVFFEASS